MSKSTKSQFYRYTLRSVGCAQRQGCSNKMYFYPVPPEDAITLEGLYVHFKFTFDSAVHVDHRILKKIGIASERPLFVQNVPATLRTMDLNLAADGSRVVDVKLDLTHLLEGIKDHVAFTPLISADYENDDKTFIYVEFPAPLGDTLNTGTINIWKTDSLYTTREIR